MDLPTVWFVAVAVLWTGYFVLEGFDFGVGILLPVIGRSPSDRRAVLGSIGPVWDGNEVWLITALGAMFAAFPAWYGALLSGLYLPVLAVVVALIVRGVALEYRSKVRDPALCDVGIVVGSVVPAFLWGLVFANIVRGVQIGADGVVRSDLLDLLSPTALLGGLASLALFTLHGAVFLALKTDGAVRLHARRVGLRIAPVAVVALVASVTWPVGGVAAAGVLAAAVLLARGREGWAFVATAVTIAGATAAVFAALYPAVLPSLVDPAYSLTVANAASGPYTLNLLSWVGAAFLPVVIGYQSWSYWIFRKRITA